MSKKFRCGRLMLFRNGTIKKLDLENGGGSRSCNWDYTNMDFDSVHHRLRDIFHLDGKKQKTSLYDFERRPLLPNQYETFYEYITTNGLNIRSTVIYICTDEADDNDDLQVIMTKRKSTKSTRIQKTSIVVEPRSSITSIQNKRVVNNEQESNQQENHLSLSEYSFKDLSSDIMKNVRTLISQNGLNEVLLQLYEYICIIHGYVCATIDSLNQQIEELDEYFGSLNELEIKLHSNSLNAVYSICKTIKTLLKLNKTNFGHIQQFSTIVNLFPQFYGNLKVLRKQWFEYVENNNNKSNPAASSSSSFIHRIESSPSQSNIESSSEDCYEINIKSSIKRSRISSSSSCSQASPSGVFKLVSPSQRPPKEDLTETYTLFQPLLHCSEHLLNLVHDPSLLLIYEMIKSTIGEIESLQPSINLYSYKSLYDAKQVTLVIKDRLEKTRHEHYRIPQQVKDSYEKMLREIEYLFRRFKYYETRLDRSNHQERSNWSSPPPSFVNLQRENKKSMGSKKRKIQHHPVDDNDQSSVVSCSSIEEEALFENAQKAFEWRFREPK